MKILKEKLLTVLVAMAAFMTALPVNAFASEQVVDPAENDSVEITASATVTDADLTELGLNVVVSFPVEIALTLDEDKAFSGAGTVYAYGIMDTASTPSVTIDDTNAAYGKVKYRADAQSEGTDSAANFFANVTETLSKESFSAEETLNNYLAQREGSDMPASSSLAVSIKNLIPTSGTGIYYTNVPLKIEIQ
uniref:hypothetical protein n=1 Tax=Agathobacter sp. TaxID=2021311 RepID=UPI004057098A